MYKCVARRSPVEPHVPLCLTARFHRDSPGLVMLDMPCLASPTPPSGLLKLHKLGVIRDRYGIVVHANQPESLQRIQRAFYRWGVHARQIGDHFRVIRDAVRDIQRAVSVRFGGEIDQHDVQQDDVRAVLLAIRYAHLVAVKEADGQLDGAGLAHILLCNNDVPAFLIGGRIRFFPPVIIRNCVAPDVFLYGSTLHYSVSICPLRYCSCALFLTALTAPRARYPHIKRRCVLISSHAVGRPRHIAPRWSDTIQLSFAPHEPCPFRPERTCHGC